MKTEYVQTNFTRITDGIRRQYQIKSHAAGVNLVPLAIGERPPTEAAEAVQDREVCIQQSEPEAGRSSFFGLGRRDDDDTGE
jgi:hypothetical protein